MMYCIVYYLPFAIVVFPMRCFCFFNSFTLICMYTIATYLYYYEKTYYKHHTQPLVEVTKKTLLLHGIVISVYELRHYHENTLCLIWSQHFLLSSFFIQLIGNQNSTFQLIQANLNWLTTAEKVWNFWLLAI